HAPGVWEQIVAVPVAHAKMERPDIGEVGVAQVADKIGVLGLAEHVGRCGQTVDNDHHVPRRCPAEAQKRKAEPVIWGEPVRRTPGVLDALGWVQGISARHAAALRLFCTSAAHAVINPLARSASAAMVRDGLSPRARGTMLPSRT